jgi:hypothetical protein
VGLHKKAEHGESYLKKSTNPLVEKLTQMVEQQEDDNDNNNNNGEQADWTFEKEDLDDPEMKEFMKSFLADVSTSKKEICFQ